MPGQKPSAPLARKWIEDWRFKMAHWVARQIGSVPHRTSVARAWLVRLVRHITRFALRHPLFVVRAPAQPRNFDKAQPNLPAVTGEARLLPSIGREDDEDDERGARGEKLAMRLRPTVALWLWVVLGLLVVSLPLATTYLLSLPGVFFGATWTAWLGARVFALNKRAAALDLYFAASPYASQRSAAMAWLPAAVACLLGAAASTLSIASKVPTPSHGQTPFLAVGAVLVVFYLLMAHAPWTLKLPGLAVWHQRLPSPMRAMVAASIRKRLVFQPSFVWRAIPDLSREVHTAGTYEALFSEDDYERPVWSRSRLCLLWYFAPIVVPLAALFFAPLLSNLGQAVYANCVAGLSFLPDWMKPVENTGLLGMDEGSKVLLGVASMVWAAWSLSFFLAMGKRDFVVPLRLAGRADLRVPATLLPFPNFDVRRGAQAFFVGTGGAAFNLLVVAIVPAYAGYLGLFSPHSEPGAGDSSKITICKTSAPPPNIKGQAPPPPPVTPSEPAPPGIRLTDPPPPATTSDPAPPGIPLTDPPPPVAPSNPAPPGTPLTDPPPPVAPSGPAPLGNSLADPPPPVTPTDPPQAKPLSDPAPPGASPAPAPPGGAASDAQQPVAPLSDPAQPGKPPPFEPEVPSPAPPGPEAPNSMPLVVAPFSPVPEIERPAEGGGAVPTPCDEQGTSGARVENVPSVRPHRPVPKVSGENRQHSLGNPNSKHIASEHKARGTHGIPGPKSGRNALSPEQPCLRR